MTTSLLEREEALDLSDLDLLDDPHAHFFCAPCNPTMPGPCVAICGKRAYAKGRLVLGIPPNVCPPCAELLFKPCPKCGVL